MKRDKQIDNILAALKRIRGIERQSHFSEGGTLENWRGGKHLVQVNKRKAANKNECRSCSVR